MQVTKMSLKEWVIIGILIVSLILLFVIAMELRTKSYDYKIVSYSDYSVEDSLKADSKAGWEVISSRRAVNNGDGLYEFIEKKRSTWVGD